MLTKFSVKNFKNFKDEIVFDLSKSRDYKFNQECIKDSIVNKSIIYGKNASGKTNLILAMFDVVSNFTDKVSDPMMVRHHEGAYMFYKNLYAKEHDLIEFDYEFEINFKKVIYSYKKTDKETFVYEKITIDGNVVAELDRKNTDIKIGINDLEKSGFDPKLSNNKMSIIRYIYNNSKIKNLTDDASKTFVMFVIFVEKMLMLYSLDKRGFIGFSSSTNSIYKEIVENDKVQDFQKFLFNVGLDYELVETVDEYNMPSIAIKFGDTQALFSKICSSGTNSLALFYYWSMNIKDISLLVIDEFDAFYHHKLASTIVKQLIDNGCQVILTTHNTSIMTNDLMRPDCYFNIENNGIKSFSDLTNKELRFAHNLGKLYTSGKFDG
ncbi:AAA family ATPase [Francisellaceae bacterium CB299]